MRRHEPVRTGFTLIEILIVVLVVAILMGVVVSAFSGVDREQKLRGYVERLVMRIEFARDKALQANREWGIYVDDEGVSFAEFDEINDTWVRRSEKPFARESFATTLAFSVEIEQLPELPTQRDASNDPEDRLPEILLFSSGETTPFKIRIEPRDWESQPWLVHSDGFSRAAMARDEDV